MPENNMLEIMRRDSLVLCSRLARMNLDDMGTQEMEAAFKDFIYSARDVLLKTNE